VLAALSSAGSNAFAGTDETLRAVEGYYSTITDLTAEVRQVNILKTI